MDNILETLYSFVVDKNEIRSATKPINNCLNKTFESCFEASSFRVKSDKKLEIESVLDFLHDELNTGHWSDIPLHVRRAFTAASFTKTVILLTDSINPSEELLTQCLKALDMGLLLGAPFETNADLLTRSATFLSQQINTKTENDRISIKRKLPRERTEEFRNLKATIVDCVSCPSLEAFNKHFTAKMPLKLQDCISHWPALTKWTDVNYLVKVAGERTVPIEIGSHYADENWSQKLITLKEFIRNYFLGESQTVGYLAQHNLFNQIPELRHDIYIPDYCCVSDSDDSEEPDINAWFGPAGTVSPLHFDPKNNLLAQVFGTKQLILYPPKDSPFLYPHDGTLLSNTAQVDPFKPDLEKFPDFARGAPYKCLLEPGDMLYIPPKWWHHVTATDKSFSVSFWWN